jgi:hypothetical protein
VDVIVAFRRRKETFDNYMDCTFYLEDLFWDRDAVIKILNVIGEAVKNLPEDPGIGIRTQTGSRLPGSAMSSSTGISVSKILSSWTMPGIYCPA